MSGSLYTRPILKETTRDTGVCRHCRKPIVWGHVPPHGTAIPLVATPLVVLRDDTNTATGVTFEIIASDQIHQCVRVGSRRSRRQHSTSTPDRIETLRKAIEHAKHAPDTGDTGRLF